MLTALKFVQQKTCCTQHHAGPSCNVASRCTIVRHTVSAPDSAAKFWWCSTANKLAIALGHLLLCQATSCGLRM
jgi:hypothetical protein